MGAAESVLLAFVWRIERTAETRTGFLISKRIFDNMIPEPLKAMMTLIHL